MTNVIKEKQEEICQGIDSFEERLEALYLYVRDEIKFGFLPKIDNYSSEEIIRIGMGQCNNKSTLFLDLCRSAGIKARIHFSGITKEIQRGLFMGITYLLMPIEISHSWVEIYYKNQWIKIDGYINDKSFYSSAKRVLVERNWNTGYSVACNAGTSSIDFDLKGESFVQMDAVTQDFGVFEDPKDFYSSNWYHNNPSIIKYLIYRLSLNSINRRVDNMRKLCDL